MYINLRGGSFFSKQMEDNNWNINRKIPTAKK